MVARDALSQSEPYAGARGACRRAGAIGPRRRSCERSPSPARPLSAVHDRAASAQFLLAASRRHRALPRRPGEGWGALQRAHTGLQARRGFLIVWFGRAATTPAWAMPEPIKKT